MKIEVCNLCDIDELMEIYGSARIRMINEGNFTQWDNKDVYKSELVDYIRKKILYKVVKNDEIVGHFAYILGGDIAYSNIDGSWLNDNEYVTIHKIASKYPKNGIASFIMNYVIDRAISEKIYDIRIDTHKNNISMNNFLQRLNFIFCGIISLNLDFNNQYQLRNAYQYNIKKKL